MGRNSDIYVTMVSYTHQVSYLEENSGFSPDAEFSVYFLFSAIKTFERTILAARSAAIQVTMWARFQPMTLTT